MKGSCFCGGVVFEVGEFVGPFELCHCNRCRKISGSGYSAWLEVKTKEYRLVQGRETMRSYLAPLIEKPPRFELWFCSTCGSSVPEPDPKEDTVEIPAGLLEEPTNVKPDKHIYVDLKAEWEDIDGDIPKYTKDEIVAFRAKFGRVVVPKEDQKGHRKRGST